MNSLSLTRKILQEEYENRRKKNAKFSQRSFAKKLKLSPATLSGFLAGKRALSLKAAEKIAADLQMHPERRKEFLLAFRRPEPQALVYKTISLQDYEKISHWSYFAFLNLIETDNFVWEPSFVARRMNLSVENVNQIYSDLLSLELIAEVEGQLKRTYARLMTEDQVPSSLLQKVHKDLLQITGNAIDKYSYKERDNTSITMAINPDKIEEAKEKIRRFQDEMSELLEQGAKTSVYQLNVHLIPVIK